MRFAGTYYAAGCRVYGELNDRFLNDQAGPGTIQTVSGGSIQTVAGASATTHLSIVMIGYFDSDEPIANLHGNLPHWRQEGVTYFVTFRLADSLPQVKLRQWLAERTAWLARHPAPHTPALQREYAKLFPERIERWLDQGYGACQLAEPPIRAVVVNTLEFFEGTRCNVLAWVVMPNHVHAVVTPLGIHGLSALLQAWKSYSAKEINGLLGRCGPFWQKETFDHIVRSPSDLERVMGYIAANPSGLSPGTYSLSRNLQCH